MLVSLLAALVVVSQTAVPRASGTGSIRTWCNCPVLNTGYRHTGLARHHLRRGRDERGPSRPTWSLVSQQAEDRLQPAATLWPLCVTVLSSIARVTRTWKQPVAISMPQSLIVTTWAPVGDRGRLAHPHSPIAGCARAERTAAVLPAARQFAGMQCAAAAPLPLFISVRTEGVHACTLSPLTPRNVAAIAARTLEGGGCAARRTPVLIALPTRQPREGGLVPPVKGAALTGRPTSDLTNRAWPNHASSLHAAIAIADLSLLPLSSPPPTPRLEAADRMHGRLRASQCWCGKWAAATQRCCHNTPTPHLPTRWSLRAQAAEATVWGGG